GQDARKDETRRYPQDYSQPAVAVDHRLFFDVPRHRPHESHHEPGAEWNRHGWVDEDQRAERVLQAQSRDHAGERDEEEGGGDHPVERTPGDRQDPQGPPVQPEPFHRAPAPAPAPPPTSVRRATRSMRTATTIRNGTRNTAMAAPWPRSAPSTPRWKASVGRTCVVFAGPPPVRMYTTPRSVAV